MKTASLDPSPFPIRTVLLAAACAWALTAQGHLLAQGQPGPQPGPQIARDIPDLHDLKTAPEPVAGKPWLPPVPSPVPFRAPDSQAALPSPRPERAGIPFPYGTTGLGAHGSERDRVVWDDRGDGTLWADGETYKASFCAKGFQYVPFLGSYAPQNYPLRMAVRSARVGTRELELRRQAPPVRTGDRIVFDRGALLEIYDLKPNGVEQTFRVVETGALGAVRVEVGVVSELVEDATLPGIQFGNALGRVDYGAAAVVRANGDKQEIAARFADGVIVLEVEESQRDGLGAPVTIDPMVSTFVPANLFAGYVNKYPDIAYDLAADSYLLVWERMFSLADSDVFCEARTRTGTYVAGSYTVVDNSTTESWGTPRVADLNYYNRFLIVASVAGSPRVIKGRIREAALPVTIGAPFQVSGNEIGDKYEPDIGGDPSTSPNHYWTVVYRRIYNAGDWDIHARQIDSNGAVHGATILVSNSTGTVDFAPQISNSDGNLPAASQRWMVVWTRVYTQSDHDIHGAALTWDGQIATSAFAISASNQNDKYPSVSSPADAWTGTPGYLVAFERESTAHIHGYVMAATGVTMTGFQDLSVLSGGGAAKYGYSPSVDSDGSKFSMAFKDGAPGYMATFHLAYGALGATEPRVVIQSGPDIAEMRISSVHSGGGVNLDYGIAFMDVAPAQSTVHGAVYMGLGAGGFTKRATGCGGLSITAAGYPCIGRTPIYTLTGVGSDLAGMLLGVPSAPVTLCGSCSVGIQLGGPVVNLPTPTLNLAIPPQGSLIGATFSVQGYAVGTPSCFSTLRLGDTMDAKIQ